MSLDVYLRGPSVERPCTCSACEHVHTRVVAKEYFSANITHNLTQMADAAGIYRVVWRPEELGILTAAQLIVPLQSGIDKLMADPEYFKSFEPSNGWGTYDNFVPWLQQYLAACREHPDASVVVSR